MVVQGGVHFPVIRQQLLLELNLFANIEDVCTLIMPMFRELMHRRLIIFDEVLTGPGGGVFAITELDQDIDAQPDGCIKGFPLDVLHP